MLTGACRCWSGFRLPLACSFPCPYLLACDRREVRNTLCRIVSHVGEAECSGGRKQRRLWYLIWAESSCWFAFGSRWSVRRGTGPHPSALYAGRTDRQRRCAVLQGRPLSHTRTLLTSSRSLHLLETFTLLPQRHNVNIRLVWARPPIEPVRQRYPNDYAGAFIELVSILCHRHALRSAGLLGWAQRHFARRLLARPLRARRGVTGWLGLLVPGAGSGPEPEVRIPWYDNLSNERRTHLGS